MIDIRELETQEMDDGEKKRQFPGSPTEINFLRRLRSIRVDIGSVVSFYCFKFYYPIKVDD
jgi:hypothetical protein